MAVEGVEHGGVGRVRRRPTLAPVITQHRVERQAAAREFRAKTLDPMRRDEIEKGRRRHEIGALQRAGEIGAEIEALEGEGQAAAVLTQGERLLAFNGVGPGRHRRAGARQQARVVIDEPPGLARPEKRRESARIGARAAGEIDDCYLVAMREMFKRGVAHRRVARAENPRPRARRAIALRTPSRGHRRRDGARRAADGSRRVAPARQFLSGAPGGLAQIAAQIPVLDHPPQRLAQRADIARRDL